jgi:hypothetical protein
MQDSKQSLSIEQHVNILAALPYMTPGLARLIQSKSNVRLLLDSGAFTMWKAEKTFEVEDYIRAVKELPFTPWKYFTLDKIGDPDGTLENYQKIRNAGLEPIPVFTRGTDPKYLDRYYETSDLVGIGGLVGTRRNAGFVKGIMDVVGDRQAHWLGFVRKEFISKFRPFSCDSSSWLAPMRWGASMHLYLGAGRWRKVSKQDFRTRPNEELTTLIEEYGVDPGSLRFEKAWRDWNGAGKLCSRSWARYSLEVERVLGTKVFLAISIERDFRVAYEGFEFWLKKRRAI